jgi:hypothetical protein
LTLQQLIEAGRRGSRKQPLQALLAPQSERGLDQVINRSPTFRFKAPPGPVADARAKGCLLLSQGKAQATNPDPLAKFALKL